MFSTSVTTESIDATESNIDTTTSNIDATASNMMDFSSTPLAPPALNDTWCVSEVGARIKLSGPDNGNEDRVGCSMYSCGKLLWVFDGHGDQKVAEYCHKNFLKQFDKCYKTDPTKPMNLILGDTLGKLQSSVIKHRYNSGTTAAVVFYDYGRNIAFSAIVGDADVGIIDIRDGSIMKPYYPEFARVYDMHEFDANVADLPTPVDVFTTRPQHISIAYPTKETREYITMGLAICTDQGGIDFVRSNTGRLKKGLTCARSIGDKTFPEIINVPETYIWKLTTEQTNYAHIIVTSDGFNNHHALPINNLAKVLCDPFYAIRGDNWNDLKKYTPLVLNGTLAHFFKKHPIQEHDMKTLAIKRFEQINILVEECGSSFADESWTNAMRSSAAKCKEFVEKYWDCVDVNIRTYPQEVMQFAVNLAIVFASDDSISICSDNIAETLEVLRGMNLLTISTTESAAYDDELITASGPCKLHRESSLEFIRPETESAYDDKLTTASESCELHCESKLEFIRLETESAASAYDGELTTAKEPYESYEPRQSSSDTPVACADEK